MNQVNTKFDRPLKTTSAPSPSQMVLKIARLAKSEMAAVRYLLQILKLAFRVLFKILENRDMMFSSGVGFSGTANLTENFGSKNPIWPQNHK